MDLQLNGRRALVTANSERAREFYPHTIEGVRPFFDAMVAGGLTPIFAISGAASSVRMAADIVFELRTPELRRWKDGVLVCERAPRGTELHSGDRFPLPSVDAFASVFSRDHP